MNVRGAMDRMARGLARRAGGGVLVLALTLAVAPARGQSGPLSPPQRPGAVPAATAAVPAPTAGRLQLVWPTPHPGWKENQPPAQWLQHAGSGDPATGGFGGVRSGGAKFHEGIDIKPFARDRRGEPLDEVFAAMAGTVRHVSRAAGNSGYGRYVIVEHSGLAPAVYTLYAHLAKIAPEVRPGAVVAAGQVLGTMGHSSGGYMIPTERSHLHFEIGLAVTSNFEAWYARRRLGGRNEHGMWNGLNLLGVDPIAFFNAWRAGQVTEPADFFRKLPAAVRVRMATLRTPDFVTRYPALLTKPKPFGVIGGWEISFTWSGLPFAWTPLTPAEVAGLASEKPVLFEVDAAVEKRERSKSLAVQRGGKWTPGKDLELVLQQLFGGP